MLIRLPTSVKPICQAIYPSIFFHAGLRKRVNSLVFNFLSSKGLSQGATGKSRHLTIWAAFMARLDKSTNLHLQHTATSIPGPQLCGNFGQSTMKTNGGSTSTPVTSLLQRYPGIHVKPQCKGLLGINYPAVRTE